ncbi:FHA domain-containing protein [Paenibacillus sp.]|jgi:DNA-binding winged helix-turn-helix (wHTH) protein|uniref:FHA domain-containing protein n=1 Tax=Paenibacillus sp. TaxID=58172 RepID=UPI002819A67C|nr:FHA domain-containing protein [Paenibacillus sp.]MDR0268127.1 FHA domain-containing protein [Paenibacillus sp.]
MPETIKIIVDTAGQKGHGTFLYLEQEKSIMIGRHTGMDREILPIYNQLVSKQHCCIHRIHNELYVEDLGSKNGTELNGQRLLPHQKYPISPEDQLTLVSGLVGLQLESESDFEETREYLISELQDHEVRLHDHLQSIQIGSEHVTLSKKEYQLFKLLHSRLDHFVTKEEIMQYVWPERCIDHTELVGIDEVNSLIYRTNKKLGVHFVIKSVYKKGVYMKREECCVGFKNASTS